MKNDINSIYEIANRKNCKLLSDKYINVEFDLQFECKCGRKFYKNLKNFIRAPRCKICYSKELREQLIYRNRNVISTAFSMEYIRQFLLSFNYVLLSNKYKNRNSKIKIQCNVGHQYVISFGSLRTGRRCPVCAVQHRADLYRKSLVDVKNYIEMQNYIVIDGEYINEKSKLLIRCPNNHEYTICFNSFQQGCRCPKCNKLRIEEELRNFLNSLAVNCEYNIKSIITPYEIDIYIANQRIGIEYHGIYWHSDRFRDAFYHRTKADLADSKNIHLIQIFEDEWLNKREIVESIIRFKLNKIENKIFARKCVIKLVSYKEAKEFLNVNHIQGAGTIGVIRLGLYYENKLISLMTFFRPSISKNQRSENNRIWELYKQCSILNISVVGGFSKLLSHFLINYKPIKIISYVDRRYFTGKSYLKCGFRIIKYTVPNYYYVEGNKRVHRFNFRKDKLIKLGYDRNKTERGITEQMGLYRIYDAGHKKLELDNAI